MLDWKKWLKIFIIIPVTLLFNSNAFLSKPIDATVSELVLSKIMGQMSVDNVTVFLFMLDTLFYLIVFNILYGNYIYEDFRYSSVYLFSRLKSRKTWFYKKSLELFCITILYTFLFLCTNLFVCKIRTTQSIDSNTILVFCLLLVRILLLLFLTTLAINLISIRLGNALGFIIVYINVVLLIFLATSQNRIPYLGSSKWFLILNPVCGLIQETFYNTRLQVIFYIYNSFLICIAIMIGAFYINRLDIALVDHENE